MRSLLSLLSALAILSAAWGDEGHHHALTEEEVGAVHFTTSCSKGIEGSFNRAVALLHSFQYEKARSAFGEISSSDPQCAMAQWGVAMSHYHGLWDNGDTAAGRAALRPHHSAQHQTPSKQTGGWRWKPYMAGHTANTLLTATASVVECSAICTHAHFAFH